MARRAVWHERDLVYSSFSLCVTCISLLACRKGTEMHVFLKHNELKMKMQYIG